MVIIAKDQMPGHGAHNRIKLQCPHGHYYTEENTYYYNGSRHCRACDMRLYNERKASGLCPDCGASAEPGFIRCAEHRERERLKAEARRKANPKKHSQNVIDHRKRRIEAGICTNCKESAMPGSKQCARHLQMARDRAKRFQYGITQSELEAIQAKTCCDLCGGEFTGKGLQPLARVIDHDHATGRFRGVIHQKCNVALGMFEEKTCLLQAAIAYLNSGGSKW